MMTPVKIKAVQHCYKSDWPTGHVDQNNNITLVVICFGVSLENKQKNPTNPTPMTVNIKLK